MLISPDRSHHANIRTEWIMALLTHNRDVFVRPPAIRLQNTYSVKSKLHSPSCTNEQAISQAWHPVHRSGQMTNVFSIADPHAALTKSLPRLFTTKAPGLCSPI